MPLDMELDYVDKVCFHIRGDVYSCLVKLGRVCFSGLLSLHMQDKGLSLCMLQTTNNLAPRRQWLKCI